MQLNVVLPLDVIIKEIHVQTCLYNTANINNPVVLVVQLVVRPINPIDYVQGAVSAQEEDVMPQGKKTQKRRKIEKKREKDRMQ